MLERLREISAEQKKMSQDVDGLYDSENVANDSINRFKQEVSLVYRRLERKKSLVILILLCKCILWLSTRLVMWQKN